MPRDGRGLRATTPRTRAFHPGGASGVMAPRAIASATISFGLVSIPVKIYPATEAAADIHFNWLHEKCGTRVKQQYYCPKDEEVVPRKDLVKGYEFAKGKFVAFTADELEALEEQATQTVEITE